jgi:hypothetical protein
MTVSYPAFANFGRDRTNTERRFVTGLLTAPPNNTETKDSELPK